MHQLVPAPSTCDDCTTMFEPDVAEWLSQEVPDAASPH
jgi:hypothetical protein